MAISGIRFFEHTVIDRNEELPPAAASGEYKQWHQSLVATHLAQFTWPNEMVHRVIVAKGSEDTVPLAFCYFYFDQDAQNTELFGVFVASPYRARGLAFTLVEMAIRRTYEAGCRSFSLPFIEESARSSSLANRVRTQFPRTFPGAAISLKYPEDPRVERIGA